MVGGVVTDVHARQRPFGNRDSVSLTLARAMLVAVAGAALLVALISSLLLLYGRLYASQVYQGVQVAGVDLGGLNRSQAEARISDAIATAAPQQVTLTHDGQQWLLTARDLGVSYDAHATAEEAFAVGRSGTLWSDSRDWLNSLFTGKTIPVRFAIDEQPAVASLHQLAPSITRPPTDATFVFDASHSLTVNPGTAGVGIDVAATLYDIRRNLSDLSSSPIPVQTVAVAPAIQQKDLEPSLKQANAMVSKPLYLTHAEAKWEVAPETLRAMLQVAPGGSGQAGVHLNADALQGYVAQLAAQVHETGKNAGVTWDGGRFVVDKGVNGETLDPAKTAQAVIAALSGGQHQAEVAMTSSPPAITDADAAGAAETATKLIGQPLNATWANGKVTIEPKDLGSVITFSAQPNAATKLTPSVDDAALTKLVESLKGQVEIPAKDAQLRYLDGKVTVTAPEQAGLGLDVQRSTVAIREALLKGSGTATLATAPVEPKVTAAMAGSIAIRDKLSSGATSYAGSVPNRRFNVELAVKRVNGALIPPGATFSFTGTIGAVDLENGYKVGYGIVGASNGSVSTVPSVGGGICQVSTTLFHAAFWAGMPIVERNWHLYWIPLYGQAPSGITGLDATVDTDYGLDFKFKNTTDNWLAVVATADGSTVRFELWGTDPGWTVNVDKPAVSNVVKADTTMKYEKTDQLANGSSVLVEHAEDGFDVAIHRQVLKGDQVVDDVMLKSHYVPSQNVTLVGTGG